MLVIPAVEESLRSHVGVIVAGEEKIVSLLDCPATNSSRLRGKRLVTIFNRQKYFVRLGNVSISLSQKESDVGTFANFWNPGLSLSFSAMPVFVAGFDRN